VTKSFVDAGHADQDHGEVGAVVLVAEQFQGGGGEPFGFVDDQQLDEAGDVLPPDYFRFGHEGAEVFLGADPDFDLPVIDVVHEVFRAAENFGGVEDSAGSVCEGVVLRVVVSAGSPFVDVGLERVPVRVAAGGVGLTNAGGSVADSNRFLFPHGVGELGKAPVFFGDDECLVHHSSSS
jgi:hypothetical protein